MKKLILMLCALTWGCATLPEGEKQLATMIAEDQKALSMPAPFSNEGRPIFVRSWAYPQVSRSGDIREGSPILVFVGREKLSFTDLLKEAGK